MAQLSAKQHKLDMLRNIINQDSDTGNSSIRTRAAGQHAFHDSSKDDNDVTIQLSELQRICEISQ